MRSGSMVRTLVTIMGVVTLTACGSTYMIRGAGGTSCVTVVEQVRESAQYRNLYAAWLLGYLTRYNFDNETQLGKGFDDQTLISTALQYCGDNPLDDFDRAAEHVVNELAKKG